MIYDDQFDSLLKDSIIVEIQDVCDANTFVADKELHCIRFDARGVDFVWWIDAETVYYNCTPKNNTSEIWSAYFHRYLDKHRNDVPQTIPDDPYQWIKYMIRLIKRTSFRDVVADTLNVNRDYFYKPTIEQIESDPLRYFDLDTSSSMFHEHLMKITVSEYAKSLL